jgi:uncharacterized protein (DUF1697 family)
MRYIALLRGINLGGKTMMKMDDLKAVFVNLGFKDVVSYINSGNLAFDTRKTSEAKLVDMIETAVEARFGRRVDVMVREQRDIQRIIDSNPFDGQYDSHKEMHVLFLREDLIGEKEERLQEASPPGERYVIKGREIYAHLTAGVANSLLTKGFFEKKPRASYTGRNWRTVLKLATL